MLTEALLCLTMNIYHEARGEPLAGRLAVGLVTMNRVESSRFPNTVCGVVQQGKHWKGHPVRNKCHFSWYCDGKPDLPKDNKAWSEAVMLSYRIQNGLVTDFTDGATHYHASWMKPWWSSAYIEVGRIGSHIFYR